MELSELFEGHRVLVVHAHPDDEVLGTGALLALLADARIPTGVVTCTRGERGEIVPGTLPEGVSEEELSRVRQAECAAALAEVAGDGRIEHYWLGSAPARAEGRTARVYRDSGMRWVTPTQAGPDDTTDERTFTAGEVAEQVADLVVLIEQVGADTVVSYDANGTYGHPDHVRAHEIAVAAAERTGSSFYESDLDPEQVPDALVQECPQHEERIRRALENYRTQLTVRADHIEHVGGQRTPVPITAVVRRVF